MNQTVLFLIGTAVFAVTLFAIMLYGYALSDRTYLGDVDAEPRDTPIPLLDVDGLPLTPGGPAPVVSPVGG
jgi:hypothetical protein